MTYLATRALSLMAQSQETSLPSSLKSLISLICNGLNLKDQDKQESQACLSTGQLIAFNMKKSASCSTKEGHYLEREPPLPIYIGLNIHQQTQKTDCTVVSNGYQHSV